jgi:hypothetical protein
MGRRSSRATAYPLGSSNDILTNMAATHRVHVSSTTALGMLLRHARMLLNEQVRSVAFVVVYLVAFQIIAFGSPPPNVLGTAFGVAMVVFGLAFFLEGLRLGLMPLGERVGIQLPSRGGLRAIIGFGVLVGVGSTLAEPAIAALRAAGAGVNPWDAPLLFLLLQRMPELLVLAVGAGVGIAVALGLIRFYFGFSLKPLVFAIIPILLAASLVLSRSAKLAPIIGLAWDTGAVTTGAVTVPMVLALGIGVSRSAGRSEAAASGFGVIMLASALPVLAVMGLAVIVAPRVPAPMSEEEFFSQANRDRVIGLFADKDELAEYAAAHAGTGETDDRVTTPATADTPARPTADRIVNVLRQEAVGSVRAVIPLTVLLAVVLMLLLRDRPRYLDEVVLGVVLALVGMAVLTAGIRLGLAPLGDEIGRQLPQALRHDETTLERVVIDGFDPAVVIRPVDVTGEGRAFFHLYDGERLRLVEFHPERFDPTLGRYIHIERPAFPFHPDLPLIGIGVVMLFAFGLGFGSTLAEPALNALGRTVEDLTVGTVTRAAVVRTVSIGVGIGIAMGVIRILWDVPMEWMLIPPYVLLLLLTLVGEEEFTAIAWDCGGVTTGPVTVPLVIAMGLGLGAQLEVTEGFGVLALASAYPIITVQLYGLMMRTRQRRAIREAAEGNVDE